MADDNNIGAVGILITGDASTLNASFAAAQANAQRAGNSIASAFTGAVSPAVKGATTLVDQYGRAIQSATQATAPLVQVTNAAAASVTRLGAAHGAAVSQIQATSGALRVLEGSGGLRAAERFIATTLGLGGAFQAIFPVVGLLAVGEIVGRVAGKIAELFDGMRDGKAVIGAAFGDLNLSIATTNDELQVTSDKLDDALAKLQSRAPNQVSLSIHEAVVEVDKLTKSLNETFDAMVKIDKENAVGSFKGFITHQIPTTGTTETLGGNSGVEGVRAAQNAILEEAAQRMREATTAEERLGIQQTLDAKLYLLLTTAIRDQQKALEDLQAAQKGAVAQGAGSAIFGLLVSPFASLSKATADAGAQIAQITGNIKTLKGELKTTDLTIANAEKKPVVDATEANRAAAQQAAALPIARIQQQIAGTERFRAASLKADEDRIASARRVRDSDIAAIDDEYERREATAESEAQEQRDLAAAKKANAAAFVPVLTGQQQRLGELQGAGKDPNQASATRIEAQAREQSIRAEAGAQAIASDAAVAAADDHLTGVIESNSRQRADAAQKAATEYLDAWQKAFKEAVANENETAKRITEIQEKSAGQQAGTRIQGQIIAAQGNAALGGAQTPQQQIAQMKQIAALEAEQRDLKLQAAQAEQRTAEAAAQEAFHAGDISKALRDSADAATKKAAAEELSLENANADLQTQYKIDEAIQAQNLAKQIGAELTTAANQVPGAIGGGIAAGVFGGGKKGEDVGQQIEKSLKNVGQQLFGSLITTAIKQLISTIGLNTAGQVILRALGLQQVQATTANTTGLIYGPPVIQANTVADAANTTATTANTAALVALTATLVAEKAVSAGQAIIGGILGALGSIIPGGGAIEAVSSSVHYASGGRPTPGVPLLIGKNVAENGTEMWIPDSGGRILPAGSFGGASGLPAVSGPSASGSLSVGEMHFHAHGMTNPKEFIRQVVREIPNFLKSAGPQFAASQSNS